MHAGARDVDDGSGTATAPGAAGREQRHSEPSFPTHQRWRFRRCRAQRPLPGLPRRGDLPLPQRARNLLRHVKQQAERCGPPGHRSWLFNHPRRSGRRTRDTCTRGGGGAATPRSRTKKRASDAPNAQGPAAASRRAHYRPHYRLRDGRRRACRAAGGARGAEDGDASREGGAKGCARREAAGKGWRARGARATVATQARLRSPRCPACLCVNPRRTRCALSGRRAARRSRSGRRVSGANQGQCGKTCRSGSGFPSRVRARRAHPRPSQARRCRRRSGACA